MPTPTGTNMMVVSYADDTTTAKSGNNLEAMCTEINSYLEELDKWFKERYLLINPTKSTATIFTTATAEINKELPIYINNTKVPSDNKPKILGVRYDSQMTFKHHCKDMKDSMTVKNNALKKLAGTTWGCDKETILSTYKAAVQPITNYCAPIYTPQLSDTNWNKLQISQNNALRTALGCVKMTPINHLHTEGKYIPVQKHSEMLAKQFLLATAKPDHPNHGILDEPLPERTMKHTLTTKFGQQIKSLLPEEPLQAQEYKIALKNIHTTTVQDCINAQAHNSVINKPAPEIHKSEKELPRKTRSILSQLRSNYSSFLNSYLSRIQEDTQDICPKCQISPHNTQHLFNCAADPTDLTAESLWLQPRAASQFLGLDTEHDPG